MPALPWGMSTLGNLSEFDYPQFRTGEGLGAALAERRRREMMGQEFGQEVGTSIAAAMQQRQRDQMANALADQVSAMYGVDVPKREGFFAGLGGQAGGVDRLSALKTLIAAQEEAEKRPLEIDLLRARVARQNALAAGGDGGGGSGVSETGEATGPEIVWKDGMAYEVKRTRNGIRYERLPGQSIRGAADGTTGAKPRTQAQQDKLELEVATARAEAEKQKAANIKKGLPNVPFTLEAELNTKARQLGVDPVTGEPIPKTQTTMPENKYGSEEEARAAGYQTGETIPVWDPASKRYRPYTLD